MLSIELRDDPLQLQGTTDVFGIVKESKILVARTPARSILSEELLSDQQTAVALADYVARHLASKLSHAEVKDSIRMETLDLRTHGHSRRKRRNGVSALPFMFERSDIFYDRTTGQLNINLRLLIYDAMVEDEVINPETKAAASLSTLLMFDSDDLMNHLAISVLQDKLRAEVRTRNAVAFVADGSILPRKSGASSAPMSSPPAVLFEAPAESPLAQNVVVDLGHFYKFLRRSPGSQLNGTSSHTTICLRGLLIPRGISLIVGGGYHGKSTLLRCIASGIHNKIPGDGREFCVTVDDAVTVRAEDGRYVNNCNVSAFISNLPTPPGLDKALDTTHFSSGEASGSTSQAANISEAIEMGASAFLVDEDVSAANFMARDGRMRSLVMDESITPLLYRVNGLYKSKGISSIVVVGGVGDWLDVPDSVILMDKYLCKDATAKARSVSKQFSHGHVQYGGRGVVHRLDWESGGTPVPRRPILKSGAELNMSTHVSIMDGGHGLAFHPNTVDADDDDDICVDLSRCEQLFGRKSQLYSAGLSALHILDLAGREPGIGLKDLLEKLDGALDEKGLFALVVSKDIHDSVIESVGVLFRPRRFEIGQTLTRLRGVHFEELPFEEDPVEVAARMEAERKKKELLELWNARRKNNLHAAD